MRALKTSLYKHGIVIIFLLCLVVLLSPSLTPATAFSGPTPATAFSGPTNTDAVLQFLFKYVFEFFGWILGMFGYFFDYAMGQFVLGFGDLYMHSGIGATIDNLWSMVRDIFNLTFIFGLVYIGFQMILGSNNSAQRSLVSLIGAALLVNFSLFITESVIDFSNLAAAEIFHAFSQTSGIGSSFANLLGLSSITNYENFTTGATFAYIFGMMAIFLVVAYVFATGAILLTIRFVVLNIYMVASPVMFLGWVFPNMKGQSHKYWEGFLSQAFFAPAFVFMLYLSYQILSSYSQQQQLSSVGIADMFSGDGNKIVGTVGAGGIFPFIALTVVFLLASVIVAKHIGVKGAATAISIGHKARKYAQGGAANLARAGLDKMSTNDGQDATRGRTNRALRTTGRVTGRAATILGGRNLLESLAKPYTTRAESTKNTLVGLESRDTYAKIKAQIKADVKKGIEGASELNALRTTTGPLSLDGRARMTELEHAEAKMITSISKISKEQFEKMSQMERTVLAPHMTNSQLEEFSKSDKLTSKDKDGLVEARRNAIETIVTANRDVVTKLSTEQLETMGSDWVADQARQGNLSYEQVDGLKKSKKYVEPQKNNFETLHTAGKMALVQAKVANGVTYSELNQRELESLGATELQRSGVVEHLTKNQIDGLKNSKIINGDEHRNIEASRKTTLDTIVSNEEDLRAYMTSKKPYEIAETMGNRLAESKARQFLTVDILSAALDKKTISVGNRILIRKEILSGPDTPLRTPLKNWFRTPEVAGKWSV